MNSFDEWQARDEKIYAKSDKIADAAFESGREIEAFRVYAGAAFNIANTLSHGDGEVSYAYEAFLQTVVDGLTKEQTRQYLNLKDKVEV